MANQLLNGKQYYKIMNIKNYFLTIKKNLFYSFILYLAYILGSLFSSTFKNEEFIISKIFQLHFFTVNNILGFIFGLLAMPLVLEFFSDKKNNISK
jgi:undecaprenyl pyrophosphate phosphatase UppP